MSVHAAEHKKREQQQCGQEKRAVWLFGRSHSTDSVHTSTAAVVHS